MKNELNLKDFREMLVDFRYDMDGVEITDLEAATFLAELGTAGISVVPTSQLTFTEASTDNALRILDDARANAATLSDADLLRAIEWAAQKLRPVPAPAHNEAALEQLAKKHPIDLPYLQDAPMVASADEVAPAQLAALVRYLALHLEGNAAPELQSDEAVLHNQPHLVFHAKMLRVLVLATESNPGRRQASPLSCDGYPKCQKGGEAQ